MQIKRLLSLTLTLMLSTSFIGSKAAEASVYAEIAEFNNEAEISKVQELSQAENLIRELDKAVAETDNDQSLNSAYKKVQQFQAARQKQVLKLLKNERKLKRFEKRLSKKDPHFNSEKFRENLQASITEESIRESSEEIMNEIKKDGSLPAFLKRISKQLKTEKDGRNPASEMTLNIIIFVSFIILPLAAITLVVLAILTGGVGLIIAAGATTGLATYMIITLLNAPLSPPA